MEPPVPGDFDRDGSLACPENVEVNEVHKYENGDLPTFGRGLYGMKVLPPPPQGSGLNNWNGQVVEEDLLSTDGQEPEFSLVIPNTIPCPLNNLDLHTPNSLAGTCGARPDFFEVFNPYDLGGGEILPAKSNVFWDAHEWIEMADILGEFNEAVGPAGEIDRCRLGCRQSYFCDNVDGPQVGDAFHVYFDLVSTNYGPGAHRTDIVVNKVDHNEKVH